MVGGFNSGVLNNVGTVLLVGHVAALLVGHVAANGHSHFVDDSAAQG
jgi:hypothetical protein